ncbi:protein MET1, chloroplastic [Sesamum angolense]|uniref:Protein MET1, chloroplastic n=1 Tax=Sesamum angolense TaxID=2727404 RepID=A0AAE2C4X7_9LAMI|nr:protein MET1, chloroplastic [Sesamum angolense]
MASSSYTSLCSSPPLPTRISHLTKHNPSICCFLNHTKNHHPFLTTLRTSPPFSATSILVTKASQTETTKSQEEYEEYEVELVQPYGLKFAKGRDGGLTSMPLRLVDPLIRRACSPLGTKCWPPVFGDEIWPAAEYGRTMYTIRQRIGPLLMKMQKRYGKIDDKGELTEKEIIRAERNAGFISNRVREIQMQNYMRKKEQKERREKDLREGLQLYKTGKYEEALEKFESILGSKPEANEAAVASYNVACCYAKLNQIQAGLSALEDAMEAGFEDFKILRTVSGGDPKNYVAAKSFIVEDQENVSISKRANSFPRHIRGPPPNGTKEYGVGPAPSNLEGSNLVLSGKRLESVCVNDVFQ